MPKSTARFLVLTMVFSVSATLFYVARSAIFQSPFATSENRPHRNSLLSLAEERRMATIRLADFLEAPKREQIFRQNNNLKLNDERDFKDFERVQNAITLEASNLIAQTEALANPSQKADENTTYGRKVIEARTLLRDIERAELQMKKERAIVTGQSR